MKSLVRDCLGLLIDANIPGCLVGDPGIGKSRSIEAICAQKGYENITILANIREPSDFAGLPVITSDGVKFEPPHFAKQAERYVREGKKVLIFIDEITTCAPSTQAALLRVILDRVCGDLLLPESIRFLAAGNPPESAAGGYDLSAPLANRFWHMNVNLHLHVDEWINGFMSDWKKNSPLRTVTEAEITAQIPFAKSLIAAFIHVKPTGLQEMPGNATAASGSWPSRRTWSMAARLLAASMAAGFDLDHEVTVRMISGCVGEGLTLEFINYSKNVDLPTPEAMLQDVTLLSKLERSDRVYAALMSLALYVGAQKREDLWVQAWNVFGHVAENGKADVVVIAARLMLNIFPDEVNARLREDLLVRKVFKMLAPVLRVSEK